MKPLARSVCLTLLGVALFLTSCATSKTAPSTASTANASVDALDDYDTVPAADPLEGFNRATFKLNDGLYTVLFRPVSKGYEFLAPQPVRRSLDNAFENVKFPIRFLNNGLQGKFKNAGLEVGKFAVNTLVGVGGLGKPSDRIPSLAHVPSEDTGQTFARWGIGHGFYLVLPILGPSSLRDGVGLAGDYALNPIHWGFLLGGSADDWSWIPGTANTIRALPDQLKKYDESRANAVDPYIAVRSTYLQNRAAAAKE